MSDFMLEDIRAGIESVTGVIDRLEGFIALAGNEDTAQELIDKIRAEEIAELRLMVALLVSELSLMRKQVERAGTEDTRQADEAEPGA